jgi:adenine-specific DNA glycosylase
LWEFPNVEISGSKACAQELFEAQFGVSAPEIAHLVTLKHSITRYRITLEAFRLKVGKVPLRKNGAVWKTPAQLHALAFTSAHRKILRVVS